MSTNMMKSTPRSYWTTLMFDTPISFRSNWRLDCILVLLCFLVPAQSKANTQEIQPETDCLKEPNTSTSRRSCENLLHSSKVHSPQRQLAVLSRMRDLLIDEGKYKLALKYARSASEASNKQNGQTSPISIWNTAGLIEALQNSGGIAEAQKLSLNIQGLLLDQKYTDKSQYTIKSLNTIGCLMNDISQFQNAEKIYRHLLLVAGKELEKDRPARCIIISNLALALKQQFKLKESELLNRQALECLQKEFGEQDLKVALSMNNLAGILQARGNLKEADTLLETSIPIYLSKLETNHPDIGSLMNNIGLLKEELGDFNAAESYYKKAHQIMQHNFGFFDRNSARALDSIAMLPTVYKRDSAQAIRMLRQALNIRIAKLGSQHWEVASSLANISIALQSQGKLDEADLALNRALSISEITFGQNHFNTALILTDLARLRVANGELSQAVRYAERSISSIQTVLQYSPTEDYANGLISKISRDFMFMYGMPLLDINNYKAIRMALSLALWSKCLDQHIGSVVTRHLRSSVLTENQQIRHQIMQSHLLERAKILSDSTQSVNTKKASSLLRKAMMIEQELSNELGLLNENKFIKQENLIESISNNLQQSNSALIEIVIGFPATYRDGSRLHQPGHEHYIAMILLPNGKALAVDIGPIQHVNAVIRGFYLKITQLESDAIWSAHEAYIEIFKKIDAVITSHGIDNIVISPDYLLHMIPWGAMFDGKKYLIDRLKIRYVNSGRDLLRQPTEGTPNASVVLADPSPSIRKLSWARAVSISIAEQLGVSPLLDQQASADGLRKSANPLTMLLTTHGIYRANTTSTTVAGAPVLPNTTAEHLILAGMGFHSKILMTSDFADLRVTEDAMLRAAVEVAPGLEPSDPRHDDMLTAEEARELRLDATQLVTLFACDAGIGALQPGHGVYGLRRAFEQAGAETVVSTLWKVHEPSGAKLIQSYYNKLLKEKKGRVEAMEEAMRELRNDKEHPEYKHPYYWAPFVVTGMDGPLRLPVQAAGK